jgi:hypothetical protein
MVLSWIATQVQKQGLPGAVAPIVKHRKITCDSFGIYPLISLRTKETGRARKQGVSLQALMAEAFDDILRKYGESPIGH